MRVGRVHDPREVMGFAAELKVRPAEALGYVMLWEEFILEVGDARSGRIKGYTAAHISAKLGWPGKVPRLISAMKNAGILKQLRTTFFHPYWLQTVTGLYALRRAEAREYEREKKRRQRDEAEGDTNEGGHGGQNGVSSVPRLSPGTPPGHPGDVPPLSSGKTEINKGPGGRSAARPPDPPPGGGSLGEQRWEWMLQHHKRLRNPTVCRRYLEAMSEEDWALCQYVVAEVPKPGVSSLSQKKRVIRMHTQKLLSEAAYLEFLHEWREKQTPREVVSLVKEIEATDRERKASARAFIQAQMSDPDLSEDEKRTARARWEAAHGETLDVPN